MKTTLVVFLLLPMTTGLRSYACSGTNDQHKLSCEENKRINIVHGRYGFRNYDCGSYCIHYLDYCDCRLDFNSTVESNLMDLCNGKKTCRFRLLKSYYESESCYKIIYYKRKYYNLYRYSYIEYQCLTVTTTLPTIKTSTTREQGTTTLPTRRTTTKREQDITTLPARRTITTREQDTRRVFTDTTTIESTKLDNSKPANSTDKDRSGRTEGVLYTTEINSAKAINYNQHTTDKAVIAGSVVGCILLVILVTIVVVFIFKRKTIGAFIDSRFKDSPRVSNPVYKEPSDGYNNIVLKNDNSPSVNVVKSDDYNQLHDIKNDNSMTTSNTYNHLGLTMGDYNHLHTNNNSLRVDEQSGAAYNHLGMVNNKTRNSDYNHLNGIAGHKSVSEKVHYANYNHLGDVKSEIPKAYYNHLDENKKISNDGYSYIEGISNEKTSDDYHHLGNVTEHMLNEDDYNHIGDKKHDAIVEYELAHNGDLHVRTEQAAEDVQYETADDERGDYSNLSEHQSNYENFPISGHQTCG
ncbi:uncharacterized protein LOC126811657 isoform X1 [Patella vulgata]|uniref:uncharacterized protein LOC126811657 isoform X1 n=1 Tax=Patella vulgata TaxID=6465 RepID=UPI00217FE789|nr:uncharacterized protein LOC126811657 isoform X1 [Patella vulgata]